MAWHPGPILPGEHGEGAKLRLGLSSGPAEWPAPQPPKFPERSTKVIAQSGSGPWAGPSVGQGQYGAPRPPRPAGQRSSP